MKLRFIFGRNLREFISRDIVGDSPRISENQMKQARRKNMKKHRKSVDFHGFDYFDVSFAILESRIFPEFQ